MVEHLTFNQVVESSSLSGPTKLLACSTAVVRLTVNQDVVGSIPTTPAINRRHSSVGRALD